MLTTGLSEVGPFDGPVVSSRIPYRCFGKSAKINETEVQPRHTNY